PRAGIQRRSDDFLRAVDSADILRRMRSALVILGLLTLACVGAVHAQLTKPTPAPIEKRGLAVELRELTRLPDTRGMLAQGQDVNPAGWARINVVRELADGR